MFALGPVACGLAGSMVALVLARALQGVGGAGLIVVAVSALGELFDRDELLRSQIWLTALAALAGPPLSGIVSAMWGGTAIFLVNVPVSGSSGLSSHLARWMIPSRTLLDPT